MTTRLRRATQELARNGPFRIIRRAETGTLTISGVFDGKRYRMKAGDDIREAKRRLDDLVFELESGWRPGHIANDWQKIAVRIHSRHKWNAKHRGIPFSLTPSDVYVLMKESAFHCPLSGIPFSSANQAKGDPLSLRDPWAPSIDRIDNRQGYTRDNIRVICVAANMGMNAWGYDTLLRLANGIVRNARVAASFEVAHAQDTDESDAENSLHINGLHGRALAF